MIGRNPLVSVLMPAYNHQEYIEDALQSVVDQTYQNIELVVVNDGSTDGTGRMIENFVRRNPAFATKYLEQENQGICRTLNTALAMSSGEYIALLASDDVFVKEKLEQQVCFMETNKNIGLVFSDHYFLRDGKVLGIKATDYKPRTRSLFKNSIQNVDLYSYLLTENLIPALTVMMRRVCVETVGEFDTSLIAEDYDMWLRISKKYPIAFIDAPLAYYRVHEANVSNNAVSAERIKLTLTIMRKQYREEPLRHQKAKVAWLFVRLWAKLVRNRIKRAARIDVR